MNESRGYFWYRLLNTRGLGPKGVFYVYQHLCNSLITEEDVFELDWGEFRCRLPGLGKGIFEELDGWIRRKLRCILWRQWKRSYTRAKNLMKRGLGETRAWLSATNGRGPWWNSGASHMNEAFPKRYFDACGLVSLLNTLLRLQRSL